MYITENIPIEELVGMICGIDCGDNPFISVEALRAEILSRFKGTNYKVEDYIKSKCFAGDGPDLNEEGDK